VKEENGARKTVKDRVVLDFSHSLPVAFVARLFFTAISVFISNTEQKQCRKYCLLTDGETATKTVLRIYKISTKNICANFCILLRKRRFIEVF
jgi:hypothetical protein